MKRIIFITIIVVMSFGYLGAQEKVTDWDQFVENTDWNLFSKNIVKALDSENLGLQVSAMRHIITYKEKVNVDKTMIKIIRLYRRDKNEYVRQLALVTIYATQNDWALGFVKRDYNYEKSPRIKRTMAAIINEQAKKIAERKTNDEILELLVDSY